MSTNILLCVQRTSPFYSFFESPSLYTPSQMVFFKDKFEAWVTLDVPDGARREEYAVEVNEQKKLVTCWIASEMGKVRLLTLSFIYCSCLLTLSDVSGLLEGTNSPIPLCWNPQSRWQTVDVRQASRSAFQCHICDGAPKLLHVSHN